MLALSLACLLLTTLSTVIGRGIDTPVAAALVPTQYVRNAVNSLAKVALFDLHRNLRVDHAIPLSNVRQITFNYASPGNLLVTSYVGDSQQHRYQASFYQYNYVNSTIMTIADVVSERQLNVSNGLFYRFSPLVTDEGRKITFTNPVDKKPYIFDTVTQQASLLADVEISLMSAPNLITWSPDYSRFSIRDADMFYVYNADGTQQFAYELNSADGYPYWSPDGRYISLDRPDGATGDRVDIIDLNIGLEHELTKDFEGRISAWWPCDTPGIAYTLATDEGSEGVLVNFDTGETIHLKQDPLLEDESIEAIIALPDCNHFVLTTVRYFTTPSTSQPQMYPLYLYDLTTRQVELADEMILIVNYTEDALYYEKVDPATNKRQLIKRMLDATGKTSVISEYNPVQAAWLNWEPDLSFATYLGLTGSGMMSGELYVLDGRTGETRPLTDSNETVENQTLYHWSETREQE